MSDAVASQLVGDQPPGRRAPLKQPAEESFSGFPITARLDEDIEHITLLTHRAPEVLAVALYLYKGNYKKRLTGKPNLCILFP